MKNIGLEQVEGIVEDLMCYPGYGPGVESPVGSIQTADAGRIKGQGVAQEESYCCI